MSNDSKERTAWVTGAGSGIGRHCAIALADAGFNVAISDIDGQTLQETAAAMAPGRCIGMWPVDVAHAAAIERAVAEFGAAGHGLDLVLCCAGINVKERHWDQIKDTDWQRVLDVNLSGVFHSVCSTLPHLRKGGGGQVIIVSSWAGAQDLYLSGPAYAASKRALRSLSASLNIDEAPTTFARR